MPEIGSRFAESAQAVAQRISAGINDVATGHPLKVTVCLYWIVHEQEVFMQVSRATQASFGDAAPDEYS